MIRISRPCVRFLGVESMTPATCTRSPNIVKRPDCGIPARDPVRPLLVEERGRKHLVEYPEFEGTYCFWDEYKDNLWQVVKPVKLDDLLACVNVDWNGIYIDALLPANT